jgi:hypothetical protein
MRHVAAGRLLTSGFGKAKKVTKASLLTLASALSKPAPKLTPAERLAKRSKNRSDREAAHLYRCAVAFMKGERADAPVIVAVVVEEPKEMLPPSMAENHPVGCQCIRHGSPPWYT